MLNAVRRSFAGVTGIVLQNLGSALSISFFNDSGLHSESLDTDWECLLNKIRMANVTL